MAFTNHHYKMSVFINGRPKLVEKLMPVDDAICLAVNLRRYTSFAGNDSSIQMHIVLDYVYTPFDLFKEFEIMQQFYDALVQLGMHYDFLSNEAKTEFSKEEIQSLRERVFNLTLLNRV